MDYLKKSKAFYIIILLLSFFFLWNEIKSIDVLVTVFQITFSTLFIPTIVSLFVYYLLKPLYLLLLKHLKKEILSIVISFGVFLLVVIFLVMEFIPLLFSQIDAVIKNVPQIIQGIDNWIVNSSFLSGSDLNEYIALINETFEDFINIIIMGLRSSTNVLFGFVSSSFFGFFFIISITPIMVIYLLKNTNKTKTLYRRFPRKYQGLVHDYFVDLEKMLSDYISGKAMVCFYVFLGSLVTFSIAGLEGALLFAVVAGVMDIVPYFGPWIGAIPAAIAGLVTSDVNVLVILIGIIIVQVGESYIVSPYVMSKELKMHPLIVIIVMIITGQAFGILGMIVILPVAAAVKVTIEYVGRFRRERKAMQEVRLEE